MTQEQVAYIREHYLEFSDTELAKKFKVHETQVANVKRLLADGKSVQEIGKQLGMKPEEVFRLSDFSRDDFLSMMTKGVHGYSKAELLTKY